VSKPRAVILDFDGVIVRSLDLHLDAWAAAVEQVFRAPLDEPKSLTGHATRTIANILAKRYGDPSSAQALVAVKRLWLEERLDTLPLVAGARELFAELKSLSLSHGVASNSTGRFVRTALSRLGLEAPVVICGDEVAKGKPDPALFRECGSRLGVLPEDRARVLVFEDSAHGVKAVIAAGMIPIGVTTEQTEAKLRDAGAVAVCKDLADALARGWLERLPIP
jgi:HAD superfamily hydrolase (TIGR01509 family)